MRSMDISPFPEAVNITDIDALVRSQLSKDLVLWPQQGLSLVAYMAWPNDADMRARWMEANQNKQWDLVSALTKKFPSLYQQWSRVADIVQVHRDLIAAQRVRVVVAMRRVGEHAEVVRVLVVVEDELPVEVVHPARP